jgi:hypothetical protein
LVKPVGQVQVPDTHDISADGQTLPQVPQLVRSVERFRHWPLQLVWPAGHWHWPAMQLVVKGQVVPQLPQLFRSVCRFRQTPEHTALPAVQ